MSECSHENTVIRRKRTEGGWVARSQCKDCGHHGKGGGQAIGKAELQRRGIMTIMQLPEYDERAFELAVEKRSVRSRHEYFARKLDVLIEAAEDAPVAANDPYYSSEAWREVRSLVMKRANGLCEGCGKREATQVHHLHYRTFSREFLWDLRAVCRACHERVHGIQSEGDRDAIKQIRKQAGATP